MPVLVTVDKTRHAGAASLSLSYFVYDRTSSLPLNLTL